METLTYAIYFLSGSLTALGMVLVGVLVQRSGKVEEKIGLVERGVGGIFSGRLGLFSKPRGEVLDSSDPTEILSNEWEDEPDEDEQAEI